MEIIQLRCPNCNADLHVENGLNTFYCQHCGTKIVLAEQPDIIRAKADVYIADTNAKLEKAKLQHIIEIQKFKAEENARQRREEDQKNNEVLITSLIMMFVGLAILFFFL